MRRGFFFGGGGSKCGDMCVLTEGLRRRKL